MKLVGKSRVWAESTICPECSEPILKLFKGELLFDPDPTSRFEVYEPSEEYLIYPFANARPVPPEVPEDVAQDFKEANSVLNLSPKASAALSRRCLQNVLRNTAHVKPADLSDEIDQVMPSLPSHLAEAIDSIRNLGNFATHPIKSKSSGEIVPVEPGEAEWTLDVLEQLFDFYYIQPQKLQQKREALNKKLTEAGKLPMK